ncbi:Pycsar system effector family protein [Micromonospora echinaurantiaca]|uniref:Pycsar system effector family protein n=1 Tax=Micromonospora echinaurantiaca TaxID=47857 RepID=UPI00371670ED
MATDDCWKQLTQVNDIVRYADAKAGLVLTLNGLLIGVIAVRIQADGFLDAQPVPAAALVLAVAFLSLSVGFDLAAVMPRVRASGQQTSLLHFDHIGERFTGDQEDYVQEFTALMSDIDRLERELGGQVWANSVVARRKYACVRWSLWFLSGALGATVVAAVVGALGG